MAPLLRSLLLMCSLLLVWPWSLAFAQTAPRLGNLTYRVPPGWSARAEDGLLFLVPGDLPTGQSALIVLSADVPLSGDLRSWLEAAVTNLHRDVRVLSSTEVGQVTEGAVPLLSQGAVVATPSGERQYRVYVAAELGRGQGRRVALLFYQATDPDLLRRYQAAVSTVMGSLGRTAQTSTPAPPPAAATLPPIKTLNAAEFVRAGGDPKTTLIPGEFRCYEVRRGDDVARPHLTVQVLPGGKYRTAGGGGTFSVRKVSGLLPQLVWQGGPLGGVGGGPGLSLGDFGQEFELQGVGPDGRGYQCYQAGAREDLARLRFALKTPQAGNYPCVSTEDGNRAFGTLEILPGQRYRVGGNEGRYTVDLLLDQRGEESTVAFAEGPWDGRRGDYGEREDGGRSFGLREVDCRSVVKPRPILRYGAAKAPAPPKGSGGLSGAYMAALGPDACGGPCWRVYVFDKGGYVYTDEPDTGLEDADCSRTRPNGLPMCEVYTVQNGTLRIGGNAPEKLTRQGRDLVLGGLTLTPVVPLGGVRLEGQYSAATFSSSLDASLAATYAYSLAFGKDGTFSRGYAVGGGVTINPSTGVTGGAAFGSERRDSGTYRFVGNTLELRYADGRVEREFVLAPYVKGGKPDLGGLVIGGRNYFLEEGGKSGDRAETVGLSFPGAGHPPSTKGDGAASGGVQVHKFSQDAPMSAASVLRGL